MPTEMYILERNQDIEIQITSSGEKRHVFWSRLDVYLQSPQYNKLEYSTIM